MTFPPMSVFTSPCGPDGTSLWHLSLSDSAKIPAQPMLGPHAFKPSPLADPNITLEGGMSSPRELCSTNPNSLTTLAASSDRSMSLIPQREQDTVTNKSSKITVSTKSKSPPKTIMQGIQTHSSRILGTSQRVTCSSTSNLPP